MQKQRDSNQDLPGWLERPGNIDRLYTLLWAVCVLLLLADFFYPRHPLFAAGGWFGFYALFGFVAYAFIVVAGWLWRKLVMRPEDYYDA